MIPARLFLFPVLKLRKVAAIVVATFLIRAYQSFG